MTQSDLAKSASLGTSTVADFELGRREVSEKAVAAIRAALELAGVEFLNTPEGQGVRLRATQPQPQDRPEEDPEYDWA